MTPRPHGDWERLAELFEGAVDLPPGEREAWLEAAVGDDPDTLATLRRMLVADVSDADILGAGVAQAADLILEPEHPVQPGDSAGQFDVIGPIGRGGMGIVYEARDRHLGRLAALKFLPAGWPRDGDRTERLLAEAKAASALDHPNVAAIYQVGTDELGRVFIAMPRYEGGTLQSRLAAGPLSPGEAMHVARQVAAGLAAAHRAGIVHRDLSSANVFLTTDGQVKILDFGLASTAAGSDEGQVVQGTVSSMSPEQARGLAVDPRTDVWAVGVLLHRMLTGVAPFTGATPAETLAAIMGPEPAPSLAGRPGIPDGLARLVDRLLSKDPARRPADGAALLAELEQLETGVPPARRHRRWGAVMGGIAVLLVVAVAWIVGARGGRAPHPIPELALLAPASGDSTSALARRAGGVLDEVAGRLAALGRVRVVAADDPGHRSAWRLGIAGLADTGRGALTLELREGERGTVQWRRDYPLSLASLPSTSRLIAIDLLAQMGIQPTAREQASLDASFPADPRAYVVYLDGNRLLRTRTPATVVTAIGRYQEAQALDSTYVPALARQAYAYALLLDWGWSHPELDRAVLLDRARLASDLALARDSSSAEAWLARAYVLAAGDPFHLGGAPEAFQRAIALDPYNSEAFHQYGQALMVLGRWEQARTAYRRALELDPGYAMSLIGMSGLSLLAGDQARAVALADSAVTVAPDMAFARATRGLAHVLEGEYESARSEAEAALSLDPDFSVPALGVLAMAEAGLGDTAAARRLALRTGASAGDPAAPSPDEAFYIVQAWLAAGEGDSAVAALARVRPRGASLWYLFQQPTFAEFAAEPLPRSILAEADPRSQPSPQAP